MINYGSFNPSLNMAGPYNVPNSTLVHEAGHALGIRNGNDGAGQLIHHPTIAGSVMSYEREALPDGSLLPDDPDCSPHPLDIMAIYAIYQTGPQRKECNHATRQVGTIGTSDAGFGFCQLRNRAIG